MELRANSLAAEYVRLQDEMNALHEGHALREAAAVVLEQLPIGVKGLGECACSWNARVVVVVIPGGNGGLNISISAVGLKFCFYLWGEQTIEFHRFEGLLRPTPRPGAAPIAVRQSLNSVRIPEFIDGSVARREQVEGALVIERQSNISCRRGRRRGHHSKVRRALRVKRIQQLVAPRPPR